MRGIATGCLLRRPVARGLAKQFSSHFQQEQRCSTLCQLEHLFRAATDASTTAAFLSVVGIGAFDHFLRSAKMGRLEGMVEAKALLRLRCCPTAKLPPTDGMAILAKGGRSPRQKASPFLHRHPRRSGRGVNVVGGGRAFVRVPRRCVSAQDLGTHHTRFSELHRNILDPTHSVSFPATHRQLLFHLCPVQT